MKRLLFFIICFFLGIYIYQNYAAFGEVKIYLVNRVNENYGKRINKVCGELGVSPAYFKALAILESGAKAKAPSRFEKHVLKSLKKVRDGGRDQYNKLTRKDLKRYSDTELKMLSTSWGPIQIMGYHATLMGKPVAHFQGDNSLENSIRWCVKEYGHLLKKGDYRNAFHYHNTGKLHPSFYSKTHDPKYVKKGLAYMQALSIDRN